MMRGSVTLRRVALELWERGRWWQYESGLGEHQQLPDLGLMQSVVLIALGDALACELLITRRLSNS
eukprot:scaffold202074_cov17-Tisochrysis_lutea.AAC.1